jgi:glycosyltransferase involved in cell wall biosynthesis
MGRIVLVGSYAESLVNFRGDLIKDLVLNGYEVHTAAPHAREREKAAIENLGATHHHYGLDRTGVNPIRDLWVVAQLFFLFKNIRPSHCLLYTAKPVLYGSLAANLAAVPCTFSMITGLGYSFTSVRSFKDKLVNKIVTAMYRLFLFSNNKIIFQNEDDFEFFKSLGIVKKSQSLIVNGSGVNLEKFSVTELPDNQSFLFIGRLLVEKGVREYLAAAQVVKQMYPNVIFRLVGWRDGDSRSISQDELDQYQSDGIIEYAGKVEDVRPLLKQTSVYVLPSYREGTPRTVLEAMAMGRAIITTDAPGCRETVVDGVNGYLVEVENVGGLVRAMIKLIKDPESIKVMGMASEKIAREKFDVREVNRTIISQLRRE